MEKLLCPYCGYEIVSHETKVNQYADSNFQQFCKLNTAHKITKEVLDAMPNSCFLLDKGKNLAEIKIIYSTFTRILFFNIKTTRGVLTSYPFVNASDVEEIVITASNKEETNLLYEYNKKGGFTTNNISVEQKLVGEAPKKVKKRYRITYQIKFKTSNLDFPGFVFETSDENTIYKFVNELENYKKIVIEDKDNKV